MCVCVYTEEPTLYGGGRALPKAVVKNFPHDSCTHHINQGYLEGTIGVGGGGKKISGKICYYAVNSQSTHLWGMKKMHHFNKSRKGVFKKSTQSFEMHSLH